MAEFCANSATNVPAASPRRVSTPTPIQAKLRISTAFPTERRASERRRAPENRSTVLSAFCAGNGSKGRQGRLLAAVSHRSGLTDPYTFVSCDDTDLFRTLICKPVWRCKEFHDQGAAIASRTTTTAGRQKVAELCANSANDNDPPAGLKQRMKDKP